MAYFAEALLDYHQQCTEILRGLVENMQQKYIIDVQCIVVINILNFILFQQEGRGSRASKVRILSQNLKRLDGGKRRR
jgi:hypothetical protein